MSSPTDAHYRWFLENGVAIVEITSRELNNPALAREFGAQLAALVDSRPADRMILNFAKTRFMSSTAFAALFELARAATNANIQLVLCAMQQEVRVGADILNLGLYIPIHHDEPAARAALG